MGEGTVLLRRGQLGDVVLLGSVTAVVAAPVTVVTAPEWVPVAERLIGVSTVIPWPKEAGARELAARLPPGRVVDLQGNARSFAVAVASGRGFSRLHKRSFQRRLALWRGRPPVRPPVTRIYAEAAGVQERPPPWIAGGQADRRALALLPGASVQPKRWEAARFSAVGRGWDGPVVVVGGPGEDALVEEVAAGVPGAVALVNAGFPRILDAFATCAVAVGSDSGLGHLAAAIGVHVVALFGPTHPSDGFFPYANGRVVQRNDLECRPCMLHRIERCPLGHGRCMDLDVEAVLTAVRELR